MKTDKFLDEISFGVNKRFWEQIYRENPEMALAIQRAVSGGYTPADIVADVKLRLGPNYQELFVVGEILVTIRAAARYIQTVNKRAAEGDPDTFPSMIMPDLAELPD